MKNQLRMDFGRLGKAKQGPAGSVRIPCSLTRCGVFQYKLPGGKVRSEYRPPEEVFHSDSMESAKGVSVTHLHPKAGRVTPQNTQDLTTGFVTDSVERRDTFLDATIQVNAGHVLGMVNSGELSELSMGYECDLDFTPGISPEGERYDCIQRGIRYNHVALGPENWGRAGREVSLHLDSQGNQVAPEDLPEPGEEEMKIIKIDGREFEYGSEDHIEYITQKSDSALLEVQQKCDSLTKDLEKTSGLVDTLKAQNEKLIDPVTLDSMVSERVGVCSVASKVIKDFKADGKTNLQIMSEVVSTSNHKLNLDGKSEDYIVGAYEAVVENINSAPKTTFKADSLEDTKPKEKKLDARDNFIQQSEQAWNKPLAYSSRS